MSDRVKIQTVIITLSDNTKHYFTGKPFLFRNDDSRSIKSVKFCHPRELPEEYTLETIKANT